MDGERKQAPVEESERPPEAPNEGAAGRHPDEQPDRRKDDETEDSFPASDPPGNY
jgi:hypothetical protein